MIKLEVKDGSSRYDWISCFSEEPDIDVVGYVDLGFRQLSSFSAPILDSTMGEKSTIRDEEDDNDENKPPPSCVALNISVNRLKSLDITGPPLWTGSLMYLDVSSNMLTSLSGISICGNLRRLDANYNFIESFGEGSDCLSACKYLVELRVVGNKLKSFTTVHPMLCLRYLDISRNQIQNLQGIKNIYPNLRTLSCSSNFVTDLKPLEGMELSHLDLNGNPIESLEEIKTTLSTLQNSLHGISLYDTLVSRDEYYVYHLLDSFT